MVDGTAETMPVARRTDDETVAALVRYYREAAGEHPDWDEFRRRRTGSARRGRGQTSAAKVSQAARVPCS